MKLYNSLTKKIEKFSPIDNKTVKIYVCGITPYDTTHLGHAFTYIYFDALIRYLKYKNYHVIYTQNITDINDRDNDMLNRAKEQGIPWQNLANLWTDKFLDDMNSLNWIMPDHYLWASAHIPAVIQIIDSLIYKGLAYRVNGGVYFDISQDINYGKFSGFSEEKMLEISREFDEDLDNLDKKNPLDITLWRPTTEDQSEHIPSFESPYGPGRPGWHIECSAMANCSLGDQIDIHGGGIDLIFPHHEAEIAQSESATGKIPFAKYWLHTQLVSHQGKKMSKSVGNLVLISDLLQKYSANAIRFMLLSHHYRTVWEFSENELKEAEKKIDKIINIISSSRIQKENNSNIQKFNTVLENDLNTPKALEIMLKTEDKEEVRKMADVLGLNLVTNT